MLRHLAIFGLTLLAGTRSAAAQHSAGARDSSEAEISARLRAFYFNLAHRDWEALTADILAAKVVAHRAPPGSPLLPGDAPGGAGLGAGGARCVGAQSVSIEHAVITVEGDWAEVRVPHCAPPVAHDGFRLIRFDSRWRFVAIHLVRQPITITVGR
jgi:hypothetical protein